MRITAAFFFVSLISSTTLGNPTDTPQTTTAKQSNVDKESTDVSAAVGETQSPTVWLLSEGQRPWNQRHKDPNRNLNLHELDNVLRATELLISRDSVDLQDRQQAVADLGISTHKYAIPALLAVIYDKNDDLKLRIQCVGVLGVIRHRLSVEHLIDLHDDATLWFKARDALLDIANLDWRDLKKTLDPAEGSPSPKQLKVFWVKWWREHPANLRT